MRKLSLWLRGDAQVSELEFMRSVVEQEEHTSSAREPETIEAP